MPAVSFSTIAAQSPSNIKPLGHTPDGHPVVRAGKGFSGETLEYVISDTGAVTRVDEPIDRSAADTILVDDAAIRKIIDRQISFELAFIEALFNGQPPGCSAAEVLDSAMRWIEMLPRSTRSEVKLGLAAMEIILGRSFPDRTIKQRQERIEGRIINSKFGIVRTLGRLRSVFYSAYYQLPSSWGSIGFIPAPSRPGFPGFSDKKDLSPVILTGDEPCDWLIIGSGAGGAAAAAALSAKGERVIVIEKGDYWPTSELRHDDARQYAELYNGGGLMASSNFEIAIMQAECVGGSSLVNNGICFRPDSAAVHPGAQDVIAHWWDKYGVRIDRAKLTRSFDFLWDRLQIAAITPEQAGPNGEYLKTAWDVFLDSGNAKPGDRQAPFGLFEKNYGLKAEGRECWGCGYCNSGCPYDRKNSVVETLLKDAERDGALIAANTSAHRINIGVHLRDKPVKSVQVIQNGEHHRIRPKKGTIIAAGTAASSHLLERLEIANVGEKIACNLACPVIAKMPHAMNSWDGVQMGAYVDRGSHLIESWFHPPATFSASMGAWFDEYVRRMQSYSNLVCLGILMPVSDMGEVDGGDFRIKLKSSYRKKLRGYIVDTIKMHFAGGAQEVYLPSAKSVTLQRGDDVAAIVEEHLQKSSDFIVSTSHPQGGNIMGSWPGNSVVGSDLRVHGHKNLYVADASVFPSSIRINAQMFTMALAHSTFAD
ncbi:GMC family oxidoreductase [Erythrobacter sp. MTPC3]|uniref:GMC family oxidoreductase n=1 Tax=Erythrobacter sp. MTPC3 TaxID=3056564 RepID=UPI0036F2E6D2